MKMTHAERLALIEHYGQATNLLVDALKQFPRDMWHYKPAPDRWSIHEIIIHLADAEANSFIRARCFIAEPGKTVMAYDQDRWAADLRYDLQDPIGAIELFKWLREMTYRMIRSIPESYWTRAINHPESGVMGFDQWLVIYEQHTPKHIEQMQRNYDAWLSHQK
jgi:hypothetical protein